MDNILENNPECPLEGLRILLADDEERLRMVVVMMMEELGATVIAVENCEEAIEIYEQKKDQIDVLVFDLRMGGIGGEAAFRKIIRQDPDARIVLVSGVIPSETLLEEIERHKCAFIEKPFDLEKLSKTVCTIARRDKK